MGIMVNKSLIIPFVEVFSKVISFLNILLFVRILSIQDYADYSYIVAIVLWSSVLMDGGINSLIYNNSLKKITSGINELYVSRFFLSIIVIVLIALFFSVNKPHLAISAIVFCFTTYFTTTSALVKMLSRGLGFVKVDLISIISEPILRFGFLLGVYFTQSYFNYNLSIVLLIYLIAGFFAFILNKYYLDIFFSLKLHFVSIKTALANILHSLKQSKYYLLYYLMLIGLGRIDVLFLENYSNANQLAIFSASLNIYQVAQLFFLSIVTSQFEKLYNNKYLFLKILVPLLVLAIIFTNIFSSYVFELLFPSEYINGQFILKILIIAILPSIINFYFITKNNYENKVVVNFVILSIGFFIKIAMYLLIKPIEGISYSYCYLTAESIVLLFFIVSKVYENITNK